MADDRGSKHQHHLHDLCCSLYGSHNVIWEYVIPTLNLRIDILIKHLGIAIEYDGEQHYHYNEFFHGSVEGYVASAKRDLAKEQWIEEHGIKLVRFRGDCMNMKELDLANSVKSVHYPSNPYNGIEFAKHNQDVLEQARQYRKERYKEMKRRLR